MITTALGRLLSVSSFYPGEFNVHGQIGEPGFVVNVTVTLDKRFSPRLLSLVKEETMQALDRMKNHAEACRLPATKGTKR